MDTRICKKCNKEKQLKSFVANKNCRYGREWQCNTCKNSTNNSRKKGTKYYARHIAKQKEKYNSIKQIGCQSCGETSIECLDYHHIDMTEKEGAVSNMSGVNLVKELLKCCVVCANCHRKIHAGTIENNLTNITLEQIQQYMGRVVIPYECHS